ncbi:MAG: PAS domain S-box protein, partial [Desulfatiglandaceae bacterium]
RTILNEMSDGYHEVDLAGNFTFFNEAFLNLFGYSRDEMMGANFKHYAAEEAIAKKVYRLYNEMYKSGVPIQNCEWDIIRKDGQRRTLEFYASVLRDSADMPTGFRGIVRDITERKRAEHKLRESEQKYRFMTEQMNDVVWTTDLEMRITYISPSDERILGFTPEERMEHTLVDMLTPFSQEKAMEAISKEYAIEETGSADSRRFVSIELEYRHKDGSTRLLETLFAGIRDDEGRLIGLHGVSRDITDRKQAEIALRESEQRFKTIIQNLPGAVFAHDLEGRLLFVNKTASANTGYSEQELLAMAVADIDSGDFTKDDRHQLWHGLNIGGSKTIHSIHTRKDGSKYPVEIHLNAISLDNQPVILPIVIDITDRIKAEEKFRKTSEKLQAMLDHSPLLISEFDTNGCYRVVNPAIERFFNLTSSDLIGKTFHELLPSDTVKIFMERIKKVVSTGESVTVEDYMSSQKGALYLNTTLFPLFDSSRKVRAIGAIAHDITERKQAEESLARQLRFEKAAAAASRCLLSAEISEASVNEALTHLLEASGVSRVYIFKNFNDPDDGLCLRQIFETCAQGVSSEIENPLLQYFCYAQGFERWREVLSQGNAIQGDVRHFPHKERDFLESQGIVSILALPIFVEGRWWGFIGFDETRQPRNWADMEVALLRTVAEMLGGFFARKQSGEILAASERRFREILQNVATVAVQGYAMDGTVRYWNRASETFYGYTAEEAFGRNLQDLIIPPEMRDEVREEIRRMADTGEVMPASELSLMRKDGSRIPVYSSHAIVQVPGEGAELYCIDIDLTDRLRAEAEKERLQAQLAQAQKMESVGRLAGGVAHDFNNKLAIINGYAELAMEAIDPSDPIHETIQEIYTAGKQSAGIVRQLLAFARKQTISPVMLDLNDTISGMLKMLQRLIGENIDLAWHPGKNLWSVKIDPSQVDQIMANLVVNSRDAISDVGKLTIETDNIVVDEDYYRNNPEAIPGQYVMLAVSDDGCGIEKEINEQLFDPYFTTKEVGKGTGLGLPTIYGIVKQNKGFINVYSEPGEGTTFKLYFPSHEEAISSSHSAKESTGQIPTGTETVLVVEDEKTILQMSKQMLERLGYSVETAGNPSEALQISEEYEGAIHLLITDVIMPEMNGRDLSSQLIQTQPGIKTLYMSGYTADVIAHHGVLDEGVEFIQKPFSLKDLAVKVREVLNQE